ncbi:type II secretion system major pseudopilin GspG [Bermanella marisrubri]|uniref:Type II secretion system core protein G n=1 Tax=Bermanella marisrubri TaxID=207949 RepID=Q1N4H1_9GAMM|nr:type II secretion system major pseudopilin GspG [Bermanella marisrubri]EAT13457.1 general secretion pathway protein G [Oceanobacter sp. RED65] [Bermanella marisrubri]QIZ84203.1 type II secretion system major pseudopilin GspG [Bermanella marisrubri]
MKKQSGFTLIEIMVVLAILAGLVAMVAPNIIGEAGEARVKTAKAEMANIGQALNMYKLDNFTYPSTSQGLEALVSKPSGSPEPKNYKKDGYMPKLPTDPWGNPYIYIASGGKYEIVSLGADGEEGGEDDAADISSKDI